MKSVIKSFFSLFLFVLACTLWAGIFFILPYFLDNPFNGWQGWFITLFHWGLECFATFFLIYFFAVNKYVFAVFFPLFSLLGSVLSFYRYAYKAVLTPMLIDASLHNDLRTTLDVVSIPLVVFVIVSLLISIFAVKYRFEKLKVSKPLIHFVASALLLCVILTANGRLTASLMQRFPFNVYYNFSEYKKLRKTLFAERIDPDPTLKSTCNDSLKVLIVIGEALRADHLSLNDYHRLTNPRLSKRKSIFSFPAIYSEFTNTNMSLPHILTRADSIYPERAFQEKSFISLFRKCGYYASWISNQDPAETYVSFINECDTVLYCHPEKSVYNYNEWLDEDLIPLAKEIKKKDSPCNLFVLHTIGSHWYYNNHFSPPFKVFTPVTSSRILSQCSKEELINSYDNTVVYTDFFLDSLIQLFENENAVMIYLSDHGETLGENGAWLHAGDSEASHHPACIVWCSDKFEQKYPDKVKALEMNRNRYFRSNFLFHSALNAANIPSKVMDKKLSIFNFPLQ